MALEMVLRGTAVYSFLFIIFRVVLRHDAGSMGRYTAVGVACDAAQNAMADDYKSVGDSFALISTLMFWNVLVDWLCYRFPVIEKAMSAEVMRGLRRKNHQPQYASRIHPS